MWKCSTKVGLLSSGQVLLRKTWNPRNLDLEPAKLLELLEIVCLFSGARTLYWEKILQNFEFSLRMRRFLSLRMVP